MKKLLEIDTLKLLPATYKELKTWNKINEIVRAHNELLETHTVHEPIGKYSKDTGHLVICSSQSGSPFECHICNPSHTVKEPKRTIWVEEAAYNRGYVTGRTDCEKSHTVASPSNSEKEEVKEECRCQSGELKTGVKWASWSSGDCPVHPDKSPFDKEQPTTPEKKCCNEERPHYHGNDGHTYLKPYSSYEVTCGRCEKSIKHSCGRV